MKPTRGEIVELEIENLAYGGKGIGRHDGFTLFVDGGLPGDKVEAKVTKLKRSYGDALVTKIVEPGGDRIEPSCTHGDSLCPGSPWQTLEYEKQLEWKQRQVVEALERLGGFEGPPVEAIIPAKQKWRYRNKMEYSFGVDDRGNFALGFHPRGKWWEVVNVDDCLLGSELNNNVRNFVAEWCNGHDLKPYNDKTGEGELKNLVVREGSHSGELLVWLVVEVTDEPSDFNPLADELAEKFPQLKTFVVTRSKGSSNMLEGEREVLVGDGTFNESLGGLEFKVTANAFFQTNSEMAETLFAVAKEYAALSGDEKLYDLFCGIGVIGLLMADQAKEVVGIELVPEAVKDAKVNAKLNDNRNARFIGGDTRLALPKLLQEGSKPDVIVVDPPRSGLSKKVVRRIIDADPTKVVYISCNPTTFAPNAQQLVEAGYELKRVQPVDMFPNTYHIECVALLEKNS